VEKYGSGQATDDNTIRRMHFSFWNTKATDTHSEYVILIAFTRQQWLRERTSLLRSCVHYLSFCYIIVACVVSASSCRLTSSTLLTAHACVAVAVGRETRQLSDNMRALCKLYVSALALLQLALRSLYPVGGITLPIFPFFAHFSLYSPRYGHPLLVILL